MKDRKASKVAKDIYKELLMDVWTAKEPSKRAIALANLQTYVHTLTMQGVSV